MSTIYEVDFISPCPVQDCINKQKSYHWIHHNCWGYEKITNEGEIRCIRCGTSGLFVDWKFQCENHSSNCVAYAFNDMEQKFQYVNDSFKQASPKGVANAFNVMALLSVKLEEKAFFALLMAKVGIQFLKKNNIIILYKS